MKTNKRNQTIDLLKCFFSIGIIAIHVNLFKDSNIILYRLLTMGLFRIGVPFFFICSGYFYYRRIVSHRSTDDYLKKLITIYCRFEIIEAILYTIPLLVIMKLSLGRYMLRLLTTGLGGIYWYLVSLFLALLLLTPLWKRGRLVPGIIIGLFLYVIMLSHDSYSQLMISTPFYQLMEVHIDYFMWPQSLLMSSILFVSIGALLYKCDFNPRLWMVILSIVLLLIESYLLGLTDPYDGNGYLSLLWTPALLFMWCLHHPYHVIDFQLGDLSLYIYMIHPFINNTIGAVLYQIPLLRWGVVALISTGLAYLIVRRQSAINMQKKGEI